MVCSKCQKKLEKTELATPAVKRKNDMYYGSHLTTSGGGGGGGSGSGTSSSGNNNTKKPSATLGNAGVSKNKLLSKKAQNPYAAYASSCQTCPAKTKQGWKYCQPCGYRIQKCAMCGKNLTGGKTGQPVVQAQKFSAK